MHEHLLIRLVNLEATELQLNSLHHAQSIAAGNIIQSQDMRQELYRLRSSNCVLASRFSSVSSARQCSQCSALKFRRFLYQCCLPNATIRWQWLTAVP